MIIGRYPDDYTIPILAMEMLYGLTMLLEKIVEKELDVLQRIKDNLDWFYSNYKYFKKYQYINLLQLKTKGFWIRMLNLID